MVVTTPNIKTSSLKALKGRQNIGGRRKPPQNMGGVSPRKTWAA
jgi:hypothetical protein